ncbi:MAG: hypothetical protein ACTSX6_14350 [Candidatus Heimdallarchaeaceae archaeon]
MADIVREENRVLKRDLISSLIEVDAKMKEKFLKNVEKLEERVQECIDEILFTLQDSIPKDLLIQAVVQFENLQLLLIVNRINENKHFTKNQIAIYFLAIVDNLLASKYEKLSTTHFKILRENIQGLSSGKSFSYNYMKKMQIELIQRGYISKIRNLTYTLKLKDKFCQIMNHMSNFYPQYKPELIRMETEGYSLIHSKATPKLDVTTSAAVVIGALTSRYFKKKEEREQIWKYLEEITNKEEKTLKRKVYRFNSNLRKENHDLRSYNLN